MALNMADIIKQNKNWLLPLVFNIVIGGLIYAHSMSVKAAIVEELKAYVPRAELELRENSHSTWAAEATKRIEGKIDDLGRRFERIEGNRPMRPPTFDR